MKSTFWTPRLHRHHISGGNKAMNQAMPEQPGHCFRPARMLCAHRNNRFSPMLPALAELQPTGLLAYPSQIHAYVPHMCSCSVHSLCTQKHMRSSIYCAFLSNCPFSVWLTRPIARPWRGAPRSDGMGDTRMYVPLKLASNESARHPSRRGRRCAPPSA